MKYWTVEFSHPVYGGRAYSSETVKVDFEGDARVFIMKKYPWAIPMAVHESKAAPENREVSKVKKR